MKNNSLRAVVLADSALSGMAHMETLRAFEVCNPDRRDRLP